MSFISSATFTTGLIPFNVPTAGKPCVTSYKLFGDLENGKRPLIALHGGPGISSEYLEILSDITKLHSIPLIIYDQIGNGLSTHLPEKANDSSFWCIQLFLEELANLLDYFNLKDNYDLLASHTGICAVRYASCPQRNAKLKTQLPQSVRDVIDAHEKAGTTDSEEYRQACGEFYVRYLPIANAMEWIQKDSTVYGTAEFDITGILKNWTVVKDAHRINSPTLLTNGGHDQVTDEVMAPFFKEIPDVQWVKFANSSHVPHFEEREKFIDVVVRFLST
ncbi:Alpha/Beta hydrolase protein [Pholiota molesta]|nr:Alpha/Beta hydrolase protein [Pholiota molesta]